MVKLFNYDFVVVFNEFLCRFNNYMIYRKIISFMNNPYLKKKDYLTKHYYSVFLLKLIILNKKSKFFFSYFFLNYSPLIIKDYYSFYYLEYLNKSNKLIIRDSFFFNNKFLNQFISLNQFKLRIDITTFFTLGRYVEYLRIFLYNEYISIHSGFLKYKKIRKYLRIKFLNRWSIQGQFRKNILTGQYIFFEGIKKENKEISLLNINLFSFFNNNIFNLFIRFMYLYNFKYLFFFFISFFTFLRPYVLIYCYNCWNIYSKYFKFFLRLRFHSIIDIYDFLLKIKSKFYFFILHDLILFFRSKLKKIFFNNNLNLLLLSESFFKKISFNLDIVVLDYISKLYYLVIDDFYLSEHFSLGYDFISPWEVLENWGHFDYTLLPSSFCSSNELDIWLNFLKYKIEFFIWNIFNIGYINNNRLFEYNFYIKSNNYFDVDIKIDFFSLFFFDILCSYFLKYSFRYFDILKFNFIFDFLNEFNLKFLYLGSYFYKLKMLNIIRIKQFKYIYLNLLYKHRYIKIFDFYNNQISLYS